MTDKYLDLLRRYWGYSDFRGIQRPIIESICSGKDTLGLMPTGGGKSITFQIPALAQEGVCIVITPLIALMKDQVMHLRQRGIRADAIYSGRSRNEIVQILENCIFGGIKILYISPERLSSELFQAKFRHIRVSLITVDEAHCISQWGYDFRPSYLHIAEVRKMKPGVPVLALTATATPEVVDDIQEKLQFREKNVFRMSFERKNVAYVVRQTTDKNAELIHILSSLQGSAIVYVRSRKKAKEICKLLTDGGISATYYHAGLTPATKDERQKAWQEEKARVIVATNAFGMGIDKADVRCVVHADFPDSIEAYFQEAGRAGRDGRKAYAVLLYNQSDHRILKQRAANTFPPKDYIRDVYEHLAYFYQIATGTGTGRTFEFDIERFCYTYKYFPIPVDSALHILEHSGYIHYESQPDGQARLMFKIGRDELYRLQDREKAEERVITALLRLYGGLFTDYVYIDESFLAQQSGYTQQQVYIVLKTLSAQGIIDFIPQKKTPYITYLQRREDADQIIIPKEVYETRKDQYIRRIRALLSYAENDHICRSRQLLHYFGEEHTKDCGQCDVCLAHQTDLYSEK
ncbi:MAG: RecQ family ATP-dependent DNA helicase, partial [Prevotella sp.]|nr:RecQ family ATP-dependent DNA helicase [Prevotella sp.]